MVRLTYRNRLAIERVGIECRLNHNQRVRDVLAQHVVTEPNCLVGTTSKHVDVRTTSEVEHELRIQGHLRWHNH
jgi:hypothetical protein